MFRIEKCPPFPNWTIAKDGPTVVIPTNSTQIGDIEIKPRPHLLANAKAELLEKYYNFSIREDDVWIVTFGKCGTTWMQELCWLIQNNYDFDAAKQTDLELRSPFFEYNSLVPAHHLDTLELLEKCTTPRVIKTHLPIGLMPKDVWKKHSKIIHITRDPKDVAISAYHMVTGHGTYEGTLEDFLHTFTGPRIPSFWDHTLEFWKLRQNPNYLFLTYEEMKRDLASVIKMVSIFLDKPITEEQLAPMVQHLSFESMKNNKTLNHNIEKNNIASVVNKSKKEDYQFIRKGEIGSHKTELPPEQHKIFNEWTRENLKDSDFNFYLHN